MLSFFPGNTPNTYLRMTVEHHNYECRQNFLFLNNVFGLGHQEPKICTTQVCARAVTQVIDYCPSSSTIPQIIFLATKSKALLNLVTHHDSLLSVSCSLLHPKLSTEQENWIIPHIGSCFL